MKAETLKKRMQKDRVMEAITIRMPVDVIDDLKKLAPLLGYSGYQSLMRAYVGRGLREDLDKLEPLDRFADFVKMLKLRGVDEALIDQTLSEILR